MHRCLLASLTTVLGDLETHKLALRRARCQSLAMRSQPQLLKPRRAVPSKISDTTEPRLPIRTETGTLSLLTAKSAWPPKRNGRASYPLSCTQRRCGHTRARGSLFQRQRYRPAECSLREHGRELGWVSSFVCALDGSESALPIRNRSCNGLLTSLSPLILSVVPTIPRVTRSLIGITSCLRGLAQLGFVASNEQTDGAAQAASDELQSLENVRVELGRSSFSSQPTRCGCHQHSLRLLPVEFLSLPWPLFASIATSGT